MLIIICSIPLFGVVAALIIDACTTPKYYNGHYVSERGQGLVGFMLVLFIIVICFLLTMSPVYTWLQNFILTMESSL